jgi:hypothetical protein
MRKEKKRKEKREKRIEEKRLEIDIPTFVPGYVF